MTTEVANRTEELNTECTDTLVCIKAKELKPFARLLGHNVWQNQIPLRHVMVGEGNHKIPSSTAIFNMGSATDCPSKKLGLCSAVKAGVKCYAVKSEVASRPNVLPFRRKQEKFWKAITPEEFAVQFLIINSLKPVPFNALRINESGDFWSQECVDKADKLARILKEYGVVAYCYTSRSDLDYSKVRALKISGSGFKKKGIVNEFKIVDSKKDKPKGYGICPMDCKICDRCTKAGLKTVVLKH